ncbi:hypothetical protein GXW82_10340 [Streptacidiphilus sp. 4-A2]|nr:hypothetical protein [Streptacidiphilus sp. 4-A2]
MSLFDFPVPYSALHGAKIYSASFGITETYSWACLTSGHDQSVDLYAPSQVLTSSNANWNAWSGSLGSSVASDSFALGYNSSCPTGPTPAFSSSTLTTDISNDIADNTHTQTLALRADDHSDNYAFKKFDPTSAHLVITYDKYPNTPSALKTVPATNCAGSTLGDTGVTIYATQSTPTNSSLTTTFNLYKTSDSTKTNLLTTANKVASDTWPEHRGNRPYSPCPSPSSPSWPTARRPVSPSSPEHRLHPDLRLERHRLHLPVGPDPARLADRHDQPHAAGRRPELPHRRQPRRQPRQHRADRQHLQLHPQPAHDRRNQHRDLRLPVPDQPGGPDPVAEHRFGRHHRPADQPGQHPDRQRALRRRQHRLRDHRVVRRHRAEPARQGR